MSVDAATVKKLRDQTGCGMMDCKKALEETGGDVEKAIESLRKKGMETAQKKSGRETAQGLVFSYIHHNGRVGVLLEVNCETDFVSRNEVFQTLLSDLCLHICSTNPAAISREEIDPELIRKEREILEEQAKAQGKPESIVEKMVDGRIKKFYQEKCLLEQPFCKDEDVTIEQLLKDTIGKLGENIVIRRFARFEIGA